MNFLEYPLEFYAKELAIENISIDVHVSPKNNIYCGRCWWKNNTGIIDIVENEEETMLLTLAHEMVHIKQHVYDGFVHKSIWNGISFDVETSFRNKTYVNKYKSRNSPWEQEAYHLEKILFNKLKEVS